MKTHHPHVEGFLQRELRSTHLIKHALPFLPLSFTHTFFQTTKQKTFAPKKKTHQKYIRYIYLSWFFSQHPFVLTFIKNLEVTGNLLNQLQTLNIVRLNMFFFP